MKHQFWFSDKQRRVMEWSGQIFGLNPPGLTTRCFLVADVMGETIEIEYTEWTNDRGSNWDDAVLVAQYDTEPKVVVKWFEVDRCKA